MDGHDTEKIHGAYAAGIRLYEEALRFDGLAKTKEDYASVEESYWLAFNKLKDSPDKRHREICADILERIARQLDEEGRSQNARDLRDRARGIRMNAGGE